MKKLIFLILLASMLCASCESKDRGMIYTTRGVYSYTFDVVIIDSCEYIYSHHMLSLK